MRTCTTNIEKQWGGSEAIENFSLLFLICNASVVRYKSSSGFTDWKEKTTVATDQLY